MPLLSGNKAKTKGGLAENIRREIKSGKPIRQAQAIAYSVARKTGKRK